MSELIIETMDLDSINTQIVTESINNQQVKNYYLSGIHIQSEVKNGNGRIYPRSVIEREVKKLNEGKIKQSRLVGELEHPSSSSINLERVSHITKELRMEGNDVYGKSMLLDTPMGKIAKSLIEGGVKLGVSTRGIGTLKESIVQNDFSLCCIDIVADPSAPSAFMDAILESKKEWVMENGILTEKELSDTLKQVDKVIIEHQFSIQDRQSAFLKLFTDSLSKIKNKYIS